MIWIFLICLALLILFLEKKLPAFSLKHLVIEHSINTALAEPKEILTLTSKVYNKGFFPIMYVKLKECLPLHSVIDFPDTKNTKKISDQEINFIQYIMYLTPHMKRTLRVNFHLLDRGIYTFGNYTLTAGDFLGMKDCSVDGEFPLSVVIMPKRSSNTNALKILGGFIGDISVRRFILEDPTSTVGFREYTGREPFKSISWLQTARTGRLYVKQYDHTVDMSVSVILNTENGSASKLEACYRLTRSVCEELELKHIPYEFHFNGSIAHPAGISSHVSQGLGSQHLNAILYRLGCAEHKCTRSFDTMIKQCIQHQKPNQGYIIISSPMSTAQLNVVKELKENVTEAVCVLTGEYEEN